MGRPRAVNEVLSLLYWSMLAASTVGPGTVVKCAEAGAEQGLQLLWALVFATALAYTLQEGAVRLTVNCGHSLGQCLRIKYRGVGEVLDAAAICWVVSVSVYVGNTLYQCNNWAGGMDAVYSLPGADDDSVWLRVGCCLAYAVVVYGLLFWDATRYLSVGLGLLMVAMAALFLAVVIKLGVDWDE